MRLTQALRNLRPKCSFNIIDEDYKKIVYSDPDGLKLPSKSELQAESDRIEAEHAAAAYKRKRKIEYDKLNQFELMYDDLVNGTTTWPDAIAQIKADIPKKDKQWVP